MLEQITFLLVYNFVTIWVSEDHMLVYNFVTIWVSEDHMLVYNFVTIWVSADEFVVVCNAVTMSVSADHNGI